MDQAPSHKLLNLSQAQVEFLVELFTQATSTLAEIKFNEPEQDTLRLRQHSALSGERECLRNLLMHDSRIMENMKRELDEQIDNQANQPSEE